MAVKTSRPIHEDAGDLLPQFMESVPTPVYVCDTEGAITTYNRRALHLWGHAPSPYEPAHRFCGPVRLFHVDGRPMAQDECWAALCLRDQRPHHCREVAIERPQGSVLRMLAYANPLFDRTGCLVGTASMLVDVTNNLSHSRRPQEALYDPLTGLPNRVHLNRCLSEATAPANSKIPAALLVLDLDRFKDINSVFGHEYGDRLLRRVRRRLLRCIRLGDTVAHLGGDEFAVLLPGAERTRAVTTAGGILAELRRPFEIDGKLIQVGVSVGIALHPVHGADPASLFRHAEVAMYAAKRSRSGISVFKDELQSVTADQLTRIARLRQAIRGQGLVLHFQPKVELKSMRVVGAEALVRWPDRSGALLGPADFLPLAEANDLSRPLDLCIMRAALLEVAGWKRAGSEYDIAVNLSPDALRDRAFTSEVLKLLHGTAAPPDRLIVEVSERTALVDEIGVRTSLNCFRSHGVRVSLDDFGTGCSSLSHLRSLPIDEVKIDRAFVTNLPRSVRDAHIVRSMIGLAHDLNVRVVAEGVEHQRTLEWLREAGCDLVQGYYLSTPLPSGVFTRWAAGHPLLRPSNTAGQLSNLVTGS